MNNGIVFHRGNQFNFNLLPVFKCYEEAAYFYTYPTPEKIMDMYDLHTEWRLKELHYVVEESGKEILITNPWQLNGLPENVQKHIEMLIDMKPYVSKKELIDTMESFNMMYVDDYSILRNFPIEGVW